MIPVTKLDKEKIFLNPYLIERINAYPDVTIQLTNGKTILVKDEIQAVLDKILDYNRGIHNLDYKPVFLKATGENL